MIMDLFAGWTDYVYFLHGLLMLALARALYNPEETDKNHSAIINLKTFALSSCLYQFLGMAALSFPAAGLLHPLMMLIFTTSFFILLLYSTAGIRGLSVHAAALWGIPVLIISYLLYSFVGYKGVDISLHYTLAFPASLAAAYSIRRQGFGSTGPGDKASAFASASMVIYALSWIIPDSPDLYTLLNSENRAYNFIMGLSAHSLRILGALGIIAACIFSTSMVMKWKYHIYTKYILPLCITLALAAGAVFTGWSGEEADAAMKNELLRQTRGVANALNPERVVKLKFTQDDISNPYFTMIRNQLISYSIYSGLRSIYTMSMINGRVIFGPESISENDPMSSPPGTAYIRPHQAFINSFSKADPGVVGPYRDEYGFFLSGYAPVIDPRTGVVMMVVGIDIAAEKWESAITSARLKAILSIFAVIIFLIAADLLLIRRDLKWSGSVNLLVRHMEVVFILIAGLCISLFIFLSFNNSERKKITDDFIPLSEAVADVIRNSLVEISYDICDLARFFSSSDYVTFKEFIFFTSEQRFNPVISREWYPEVKYYRKDEFEASMRAGGAGNYKIYDMKQYDKRSIPGGSSVYYPLAYSTSGADTVKKPGFNLLSDINGRIAIEKSLRNRLETFVEYKKLKDSDKEGGTISVLHPVFRSSRGNLLGFVLSTTDIQRALSCSISSGKIMNRNVTAGIIDITTSLSNNNYLAFFSKGKIEQSKAYSGSSKIVYPLFIFDRVFGIEVSPAESYMKVHLSRAGVMGGISGIILTISISILLSYLRRRQYSLEDEVHKRTVDLGESEERFRALHEASFGGIALHENGIILECNKGLTEITGYTSGELIGMNGMFLIEPEWRDFVMKNILSGFAEPYDALGLKKDGSVYPLEIRGKDIPYHGRIVRVTEFRDITERKRIEDILKNKSDELERINENLQAEMEEFEAINGELINTNQQLAESDEKFSRAFSINPAIMVISTIEDGRLVEVNESFVQVLGYSREFALGKTVYELNLYIDTSQRDMVLDFIRKDGIVRNIEVKVRTKTGEIRNGLFSADYITVRDVKYMLTVMTDITERKRIEEALRESEEKYRLLFETAGDAIFLIYNGVYIDCNSRACGMLGMSRDEIVGYSPVDISPEFQPDGKSSIKKSAEKISLSLSGETQFFEWQLIRRDGTFVDAEVTLSMFEIESKIIIHSTVKDVTERKKIEMRLNHMQKMDAIGQLAGGIAHDFNNQLSGILGYAELLSARLSGSDLKKYSDGIISVAMRSADLTKKLLAFARKGQFQLVQVNVHLLIDETIEILKHSIDRRISIIKKYKSGSAVVTGDPAQLQNAFLNLGLNARDAMPDGGTLTYETAEVYLESDLQNLQIMDVCEGNYIVINVTDTGTGMTDNIRSHLFEPFFTTKASGKGTGMGLASVYGTVKNHNGTINVYSEPGIGTTFRIYLPLSIGDDDQLHRASSEDHLNIPPKRILIIDDEDVVRNVLAELLRDIGHTVYEAVNGQDGVSLYRDRWRETDLVIIDMIMPEMNGRDAFLEMKGINPGIKAILSSGFSMDEQSQSMLADGVMGFIHKPYRKSELLKKISEII